MRKNYKIEISTVSRDSVPLKLLLPKSCWKPRVENRRAKLCSQLVNLPSAQPVMNPLPFCRTYFKHKASCFDLFLTLGKVVSRKTINQCKTKSHLFEKDFRSTVQLENLLFNLYSCCNRKLALTLDCLETQKDLLLYPF